MPTLTPNRRPPAIPTPKAPAGYVPPPREQTRPPASIPSLRGQPITIEWARVPFWRLAAVAAVMAVCLIGAVAFVHGCVEHPAGVLADPRPSLIAAGPLVHDKAEDVGHQADTIDDAGRRYSDRLIPAQRLVWRPYEATINTATSAQRQDVGALQTVPTVIATAVKQTDVLVDANDTLRQENADLEAKLAARGQLWLTLLIVGGCIGVAVGIADAVEGNVTAGVTIITFSAALAVVATVLRDHAELVIGSAVVLLVGGGVYAVVKRVGIGSVAADAKALAAKVEADGKVALAAAEAKSKTIGTELVAGYEIIKQDAAALMPELVKKWFGNGVTGGVLGHTQGASTKTFVTAVRSSGAVPLANTVTPTPVPAVTTIANVSVVAAPAQTVSTSM